MSKPRIAINGMGRIGRLVLKLLIENDEVEVVAINDLAPNESLLYLIKYDTVQKHQPKSIFCDGEYIVINGKRVHSTSIANPLELPWKENNIDIVVECTGIFRKKDKLALHLGVNDHLFSSADTILSNASCTTNCLAPMVKVMNAHFGIEQAIMSTIHAYTGDQNLHDAIHKSDMRRARAAAENLVPTTSNATSTVEVVMPEMKGKLTGGAVRVPVIAGSITELYCNIQKTATVEQINQAFLAASEGDLKGILAYNTDPIVSSDIIHNPHSCIFDADLTLVLGNMVKITGWYDNEYGYANRLCDLVVKMGQ